MAAIDIDAVATETLINHQRYDITGCVCGWSELGKSHPRHQVAMLRAAGLLATTTADGSGEA